MGQHRGKACCACRVNMTRRHAEGGGAYPRESPISSRMMAMTPMKQPKAQMMYWLILTMVLPVQGMNLMSACTLLCTFESIQKQHTQRCTDP